MIGVLSCLLKGMPNFCCIMEVAVPGYRLPVPPCALAKILMRICPCFFAGVRTEQDLYVRLIDSMTKQVRKFKPRH